jgi:hypothetical protein
MSRAIRVANLLPSSLCVLRPRTFRHVANHRLFEHVLRPYQRPNSTQANTRDLMYRPANSGVASGDLWDEELTQTRSTVARGGYGSMNPVDQIQEQLLADGHRVWGLVIYRCTYGDDAAWETCLRRLNTSIRRNMRFYCGLDLLANHNFKGTVIEDASQLDGVSTHVVRRHFREWRDKTFCEEQGSCMGVVSPDSEDIYPYYSYAVRYRFCVQIDKDALQSIITCEDTGSEAWVSFIEADWDLQAILAQRAEDKIEAIESGLDPEDFDKSIEFFPEIEGCNEENVGWMKTPFHYLIPDFYSHMRNPEMPDYLYYRPPDIGC